METLTYSSLLRTPDITVLKDHMSREAIYQSSTRGSYFKVVSDKGVKKINFLCDSLRLLFYLIIILYISSTVVNQNIQFFFELRRLSTEMSPTLLTFMYNFFLLGFFETMTKFMRLFPANPSLTIRQSSVNWANLTPLDLDFDAQSCS